MQVDLEVIPDPVSGFTGSLEGVFFHVAGDAVFSSLNASGVDVTDSVFGPLDSVLNLGGGVNLTGEGQTGFDFGIRLGDQGAGTALTSTTFTILGTNLDVMDFVNANPDGNDIGIRLKGTTGPAGSSKLGGEILPPVVEPPEDGIANTPGFWKQSQHFDYWVEYAPNNNFADIFGLTATFDFDTRKSGSQDTLLDALSAGGGGVNALARAGTAALLNAASDPLTGINYIYTDEDALKLGMDEVYGAGNWSQAQFDSVIGTLNLIDGINGSSADGRINVAEVKLAVQDALGVSYGGISGPLEINQVAIAFDVLNNMPSLAVGQFPAVQSVL